MSAFQRALVIGGDCGSSAGFWDCNVKKVSLGLSKFKRERMYIHMLGLRSGSERMKGQFVLVIFHITPWFSHIITLNSHSMEVIFHVSTH